MDSAEAGTFSAVYSEYIVTSENAPPAYYTLEPAYSAASVSWKVQD